MQIPNSTIHIQCADGRGYGPLLLPAYYERLLRRVFFGRLDPTTAGKGITVSDYPANGNDDTRYRTIYSVAEERGLMRQAYKADKNGFIDQVYTDEELEAEMAKAMTEEAKRLTLAQRPKEVITPHESFVSMGLTDAQAVSLQVAGFANRAACVGVSILKLNAVEGISLDLASKLLAPEPKAEIAKAK